MPIPMTDKFSGAGPACFSVCETKTHKPEAYRQSSNCHRIVLALTLISGVMTTPDVFSSQGLAHAQLKNSQGDEMSIVKKPTSLPDLPAISNGKNKNNKHSCEIVVVSPGTIGANIENRVLSSKLIGGRAGTAHIKATNSSYSLTVDNPVGFSTMPAGGSNGVIMTASFMGNGVTNFSETPGNYDVRIKKGLTIVQAHMTAERTDGDPFPAGFYSAQLTLRCE